MIFHRHRRHSHSVNSMDYYASQSGIRHWNDSYKVISACSILLLCILLNQPVISIAVILTMGFMNVKVNGVSFYDYAGFLKIPVAFLILGSAAVACGISRSPAGDYRISLNWFYLYVTEEGIKQAAELVLKAMGAVSAMYFLALSTPAHELTGVLKKAHVPRIIVELMDMIYRFIFILTEVQGRMKTAAMSRLGYTDFKTSCYSFGQTGGNLFLLSLKKANACYDAMISRCYEGELPFWEEEKQLKIWQVALLAAYEGSLIMLFLILR